MQNNQKRKEKRRVLNGPLIGGSILLLIALAHGISTWFEPANIWWTPSTMLLNLDQAQDRVEVLISGKPLREDMEKGTLWLHQDSQKRPVTEGDVWFRFNNRDRVRASRIPLVIMLTVFITLGILMIIFGLMLKSGRIRYSHNKIRL